MWSEAIGMEEAAVLSDTEAKMDGEVTVTKIGHFIRTLERIERESSGCLGVKAYLNCFKI